MQTENIRAGEPLIVSILAPGRNLDPLAVDSFDIILTTPSGDREVINIVETTVESTRFVGMINTAAIPPAPVQGDCIFSVKRGDILDISFHETNGNSIGTANVGILVDSTVRLCNNSVDLPIPGSPPINVTEPGTRPPATQPSKMPLNPAWAPSHWLINSLGMSTRARPATAKEASKIGKLSQMVLAPSFRPIRCTPPRK